LSFLFFYYIKLQILSVSGYISLLISKKCAFSVDFYVVAEIK